VTARLLPDDAAGRDAAIATLRAGGLVALPTDTVYGIGVAPGAPDGLTRLFAAKDRPLDKAIVLLVADAEQAASVGVMSPAALVLAERFWPGGLTLVLAQVPDAGLPAVLTGGAATIGVRIPDHDCPRALARELGPLPVTSANLSGRPDAHDATGVLQQLGESLDLILDGGPARGGVPSTVVDCSGALPRVLRAGAVGPGALVDALEYTLLEGTASSDPYAGKARAVRVVGIDVAVEAARRYNENLRATGAVDDADFWAALLGLELGAADPDLGWEFVCRLVDAVPDEVLDLVGAGELEDFCSMAAASFIDRIEARGREDPRFRTALGSVWQQGMPDDLYRRIRIVSEL
jgi:L-threonylcarbamoyladenylate synthase